MQLKGCKSSTRTSILRSLETMSFPKLSTSPCVGPFQRKVDEMDQRRYKEAKPVGIRVPIRGRNTAAAATLAAGIGFTIDAGHADGLSGACPKQWPVPHVAVVEGKGERQSLDAVGVSQPRRAAGTETESAVCIERVMTGGPLTTRPRSKGASLL